jgi:hypothetical protein
MPISRRTFQKQPFNTLRVQDALPSDARARVVVVAPTTSRDQIAALLRQPAIIACLITPDARDDQPPLGVFTHADPLYRI